MVSRQQPSKPWLFLFILIALLLVVSACGSDTSATGTQTGSGKQLTNVTIGLGYIPDVQFAPFYVAQSKGYYKDAGLNVTFNHGIVNDLIGSLVAGKNDFVFGGGDEELVARSKNIDVRNVGTVFQKYPASLIVPEASSIKKLGDIKGHTIGIPGPYGANYVGLLALLHAANLSQTDVKIQSIGFTQVAALVSNKVDAVVGYSNNEPLQLKRQGFKVRTFNVSDYQPLISNGIITTNGTWGKNPDMVKRFVQATLKGVQEVINNPDEGVSVSQSYVKTLTDKNKALEILNATILLWKSAKEPGYNDPQAWESMSKFLLDQKIIPASPDLTKAYTNDALK